MTKSKHARSEISGMSSDYQVKSSFKQILGRNSIGHVQDENNRKEELMGCKRKRIINDSILGGLFLSGSLL